MTDTTWTEQQREWAAEWHAYYASQHVQQPYPNGPVAPVAPAPSAAPTFWVTVLFGIFGLIPLFIHAGEAKRLGYREDTGRYVGAFVFGLIVEALIVALFIAVT